MKNIGLNEIVGAMLSNQTDNIEATYKTKDGLELTLDIFLTKVIKDGKTIYEAETESDYESN